VLRERGVDARPVHPYGLVGPKDLPANIVQTLHEVVTEANNDPQTLELLGRYIQVPWKKNPAEYKAFAQSLREMALLEATMQKVAENGQQVLQRLAAGQAAPG